MNRIVREHYPVSKLPEDLQTGLSADRPVSIIILQAEEDERPADLLGPVQGGDFTRFKHLRRATYKSSAEVDAYIDASRSEWTHRDR